MAMLKVGPYPHPRPSYSFGSGVSKEIVWDEKGRTKIAQIFISYGDVIRSIAFRYIQDNKLVTSPWFGNDKLDAPNFVTVTFKEAANNEYVTRVSGSYGEDLPYEGLTSLTFQTNAGCYGPFGNFGPNDTKFDYRFGPENQFGGFHGISTEYFLRSIGVHVNPINDLSTLSTTTRTQPVVDLQHLLGARKK